jgi:hypothetical protein
MDRSGKIHPENELVDEPEESKNKELILLDQGVSDGDGSK